MKKQISTIIVLFMLLNSICMIVNSQKIEDKSEYIELNNYESSNIKIRNHRNILQIYELDIIDLLTSHIYTTCNGYEKTSETFFALSNEINVDGDDNTGINGNDIRVQYLILPWFDMNPDLSIGLKFLFNVERIGEEIKNNDFNLSASIGNEIISIGYYSPDKTGNEIPKTISFSLLVFINTNNGEKGLKFNINPTYESSIDNKEILLFGKNFDSEDDIKREYYFSFNPSTESEITITSTRNEGEWNYEFIRNSNYNIDFTSRFIEIDNGITKDTVIKFFSFPKDVSFNLLLTPFSNKGGSFKYQSDSMYDTRVQIHSNNLGICKYAIINNIPRKLIAEWLPIRENGYYHLTIDSDGTDISLLDSLVNPTINLSLNSVTDLNMTAYWNFTNPGDFRIMKEPSLNIDISVILGEWEFLLNAKPIAKDIKISWLTDITGYLAYDTNWQPLNQMDLLIKGSALGIRAVAEVFKSQDFRLDWTIWPPLEWNLERSGEVDHISLLIEVYIEGNWLRLWPW